MLLAAASGAKTRLLSLLFPGQGRFFLWRHNGILPHSQRCDGRALGDVAAEVQDSTDGLDVRPIP